MSLDTVIIGAGPAGLSAALNLVRARRSVLIIDSNRPRNAATLVSHGFLTRDGVSPLELRRLGCEEIAAYDGAEFRTGMVERVERSGDGFRIVSRVPHSNTDNVDESATLIIATGLSEELPSIANVRAYYGTQLHSCIECDAYEKKDEPLVLVGQTDDLAEHALLLSQWNGDLIVFTNGIGTITVADESRLSQRNIRVDRRHIAEIIGERGAMTGVRLVDGDIVLRRGGFVRPLWKPNIDCLSELAIHIDGNGFLITDVEGRTSVDALYAVGDCTAMKPRQLITAAGEGARVASAVNNDLLRNELK